MFICVPERIFNYLNFLINFHKIEGQEQMAALNQLPLWYLNAFQQERDQRLWVDQRSPNYLDQVAAINALRSRYPDQDMQQ